MDFFLCLPRPHRQKLSLYSSSYLDFLHQRCSHDTVYIFFRLSVIQMHRTTFLSPFQSTRHRLRDICSRPSVWIIYLDVIHLSSLSTSCVYEILFSIKLYLHCYRRFVAKRYHLSHPFRFSKDRYLLRLHLLFCRILILIIISLLFRNFGYSAKFFSNIRATVVNIKSQT